MAPETIRKGTYSQASDVWAYGVTVVEFCSGGAVPYGKKVPTMEVARLVISQDGPRPEIPGKIFEGSTRDTLVKCFEYNAADRPSFDDIVDCFEDEVVYASLSDLNCRFQWAGESSNETPGEVATPGASDISSFRNVDLDDSYGGLPSATTVAEWSAEKEREDG